jgi:hypothetical protein
MKVHRKRRLRLSVGRALDQIERGRLPQCPRCEHPVMAHAVDEERRRVCTRTGQVSCLDCARAQAVMPAPVLAVFCLSQAFKLAPRPESWRTLVLT